MRKWVLGVLAAVALVWGALFATTTGVLVNQREEMSRADLASAPVEAPAEARW